MFQFRGWVIDRPRSFSFSLPVNIFCGQATLTWHAHISVSILFPKRSSIEPLSGKSVVMVRISAVARWMERQYSSTFIDTLRIHVKGGAGGAGVMHLGGVGGVGGNVYAVGAKDPKYSLRQLKQQYPMKRFSAEAGESSRKQALSGLKGRDIFIQIPHGIVVRDADTKAILGSINKADDRVLLAKGGKGGDRFNRFQSEKGKARNVLLDLRLIADIGFVGFPNAGKSTLLNAISRAKTNVADYPFTTLRPHIGTMQYRDKRTISCADLPGLIEGSHMNFGMGHNFLKHIERTKLLLFMVDVFGFSLYVDKLQRDAFENIQLLTKELELYNSDLINRPAVLVFNKLDIEGADEKLNVALDKLSSYKEHLHTLPNGMIPRKQMKFCRTFCISAKHGKSLKQLKLGLRQIIDSSFSIESDLLPDGSTSVAKVNGSTEPILELS